MLRNTQKHSHAVVAPQKIFDERKVAAFRKFCTDFFDEATAPKDPLELARHGSDKLHGKLDELKARVTGSKYPFVEQLAAPIALLEQAVGKPDEWYLTEFGLGDELLDAKESVIDPIQAFLNGGQRAIYDDAAGLLAASANNLGYLPAGSDAEVKRMLDDPNAFRGNRMTQLKQAAEALGKQIEEAVATNRTVVVEAIGGRKTEMLGSLYYGNATEEAQERVIRTIDQIIARLGSEKQIALIREQENSFEETIYPSLLDQLASSPRPTGTAPTVPNPGRSSRPSRSRRSPCPAFTVCWRPRRTSTGTSTRSATRCCPPSTTESESHSDGNRTAEVIRHLGAHRAHPRGDRPYRRRAGSGVTRACRAAQVPSPHWRRPSARRVVATRVGPLWPTRLPTPGSTASSRCASWTPTATPASASSHPNEAGSRAGSRRSSPRPSAGTSTARSSPASAPWRRSRACSTAPGAATTRRARRTRCCSRSTAATGTAPCRSCSSAKATTPSCSSQRTCSPTTPC